MSERCQAEFYGDEGWPRLHRCSRNATCDGYCAQHHPDAAERRKQERDERSKAQRAAEQARWDARNEQKRRAECFDDLLAALRLWDSGCRCNEPQGDDCQCYGCITRRAIAKATGAEGR